MQKIIMIILLGFILRLYGINWDQGFHLHPDERALIMVAEKLSFFKNLDPGFFNYGSLPIYILKISSQILNMDNYQSMLYVGRSLSVLADLLTVFLIYRISLLLFKNEKVSLFSSFFYTIAFFPIQNSHFFIVDVFLTLFVTLSLYLLLVYLKKRDLKSLLFLSIAVAASLGTKITAAVFLPVILIVILKETVRHDKGRKLAVFSFTLLAFSFLFMPFAYLNYPKFLEDTLFQLRMNRDPYVFPYTLQYIGTLPYFHYLKNIFLWGLGPVLALLSVFGLVSVILKESVILNLVQDPKKMPKLVRHDKERRHDILVFLFFYGVYFLVIGASAVKFMRYMLPLYPFFAILGGYGLYNIRHSEGKRHPEVISGSRFRTRSSTVRLRPNRFGMALGMVLVLSSTLYVLLFLNIYSKRNTRVAASSWINKHIPKDSTLAVEHWDDRLPLFGTEKYKYEELALYELPDDKKKWDAMNEKLKRAAYIIVASNRLYVPLQKLSDCSKFKICYPKTAKYYKKLFNGENVILNSVQDLKKMPKLVRHDVETARFMKVAEFRSYPGLEIGNWKLEIRDDSADESFTVYDHPKVMIFRKIKETF